MIYVLSVIGALQLGVLAWIALAVRRSAEPAQSAPAGDAHLRELRRLVAFERAKHARARGDADDVEDET